VTLKFEGKICFTSASVQKNLASFICFPNYSERNKSTFLFRWRYKIPV